MYIKFKLLIRTFLPGVTEKKLIEIKLLYKVTRHVCLTRQKTKSQNVLFIDQEGGKREDM